VRRELDLICRQDSIPEVIEIDLEQRNIGQSIHISHIALPDGVESAITDRDFTIATIVGRRGEKDTEDKAAAGTEAAATPAAAAPAAKAGDAKKPATDAKKK
jgi:large subunit ribosomal protein L25